MIPKKTKQLSAANSATVTFLKKHVYNLKQNDANCCMFNVSIELNEDVCDRIGFYMWRNSYIKNLTLRDCDLSPEKMKKLFSRVLDQHEQNESNDYLKNHGVLEKIFNVGDTSLTGRVMDYLACTPFSKLLHVNLSQNNIGTNGLNVLVKAISGVPVSELHLVRCKLNDLSPFIVGGRKLKELKSLNLEDNQLDSTAENARALSVLFDGGHPRMKELCLRGCGIDSELIEKSAPALSSNKKLLYLHLLGNPLEDRGVEALIKTYCNSTSFERILTSNHTIRKISVGDRWLFERSESEKALKRLTDINFNVHRTQERSLIACRKLFSLVANHDDVDPSMFGYFDIGLAPLIFSVLLNRQFYNSEAKESLTAIYKILKCKSFRERLKLSSQTNRPQIDHNVLRETEEEVRMKNEQLEADNAALLEENRKLKEQIALLMAQNGTATSSHANYYEAEQNVGSIAERVKMRAKRRKLGRK